MDINSCLTVLIPAKLEEGIGKVIEELHGYGISNIITIVDDFSDPTAKIAESLGSQVLKSAGTGKASAVYTGLKYVKTPFALIMDGDYTYDPGSIIEMLKLAIQGDLDEVLGARLNGRHNIPALNRFGNAVLTGIFNLLFGTRLSDVLTGMYLLRSDTAGTIIPGSRGFSVEVDIASQMASMGKIGEHPINYRKRIGKPKLKWSHGLSIGIDIIRLMIRYNPILIFSLAVALLLVPGALLTIYTGTQLLFHHVNHFIWGIIAVELTSTGMIGLMMALLAIMIKRLEFRLIHLNKSNRNECEELLRIP
ncbi:MAG: glycosyltransferase family 2 protein [Thermocladium sp.]